MADDLVLLPHCRAQNNIIFSNNNKDHHAAKYYEVVEEIFALY